MRKISIIIFAVLLKVSTLSAQTPTARVNFSLEDPFRAKYFVLAYPKDTCLFKIEQGDLLILTGCCWTKIPLPGTPIMVQKRRGKNYVTISFLDKDNPGKVVFIKYNRKELIFT